MPVIKHLQGIQLGPRDKCQCSAPPIRHIATKLRVWLQNVKAFSHLHRRLLPPDGKLVHHPDYCTWAIQHSTPIKNIHTRWVVIDRIQEANVRHTLGVDSELYLHIHQRTVYRGPGSLQDLKHALGSTWHHLHMVGCYLHSSVLHVGRYNVLEGPLGVVVSVVLQRVIIAR